MTNSSWPALSRRRLLKIAAASPLAAMLANSRHGHAAAAAAAKHLRLQAAPGSVSLVGNGWPDTRVWAFEGTVPGPVLRVRQGEPIDVLVENGLSEDTTVHWHGIRVPIGMDGVPGLSQTPIKPGASFLYTFTPPDAGTFWYHSHSDGLVQMGRGLAGALIVEESEAPSVDRDLLWAFQDWRLTDDAQIAPGFGNRMDAGMDGRIGNTVTVNGRAPSAVPVRAGERLRLRLLNASIARIMALRFDGHRPIVIALDGQPCEPHAPDNGRVLLGPAMRADVILDLAGEPGRTYKVIDDFYDDLAYTPVRLVYDPDPPLRQHPLDTSIRLPANPVPRPDLDAALHHEVRLQGGMMSGMGMGGGMMGGMMSGGAEWAINGMSMTGDGQADMSPLFSIERGRSCVLDLKNETAWWHPMHLHGHSFQVISRDGDPVAHNEWGDTVLVQPRQTVRVAFVADNPGDWMLHCHVMDHQTGGLMTVIRVA